MDDRRCRIGGHDRFLRARQEPCLKANLFFGDVTGRDVFDRGDEEVDVASRVASQRGRHVGPHRRSIFSDIALLGGGSCPQSTHNVCPANLRGVSVVRMRRANEPRIDQLLLRVTELLAQPPVRIDPPAVQIGRDDADRREVKARRERGDLLVVSGIGRTHVFANQR